MAGASPGGSGAGGNQPGQDARPPQGTLTPTLPPTLTQMGHLEMPFASCAHPWDAGSWGRGGVTGLES